MSLPAFFFDRVTGEIVQQMEGVLALTGQLERMRLTPDAQSCVSGVSEAAGSVRRMMESAIALRKLNTDGLDLEPESLRLRELVDEVHARWQPAAAASGVTLLVSYDGEPEVCAMGDRTRLLQVFDGLVGEAVATVRRGAIEASLRTVVTGDSVCLEGRVRGARDTVWDDSQDLESRIRSIENRFGLEVAVGAVLSRQLVADLGGAMRSEGAGGAETVVFALTLPLSVLTPESDNEETAAERSVHVLVVDDNATNRMVAQALCEMFDCTCESANDGSEAVEAARGGRFDLILMDIKMPVMDGVAATRAIRAMGGKASQVPIIALTANAEPEDAEGYLAAGMNGVVEKPMKPEHLLAALQAALGESDAAAAAA